MQLIFSSTCAVYGNPDALPVTEDSPTNPINPYGRAKLMAELAIQDVCQSNNSIEAVILRYFNVYGSDPDGLLGEFPDPSLRQHSRISGACLDAALKKTTGLTIRGAEAHARQSDSGHARIPGLLIPSADIE
jgi:UDP-arabinose 4-epimerase